VLKSLYHDSPAGDPRLLFKGRTSLSKAYGLIDRFSEDIDVTVFRDDIGHAVSVEELESISSTKRRAQRNAIRDARRAYIAGPLQKSLVLQVAESAKAKDEFWSTKPTRTDKPFLFSIRRRRRMTEVTFDPSFASNPEQNPLCIPIDPSPFDLTSRKRPLASISQ
jgi:predicted nucleotidyltransferase component of viral defense system